MVGKFYLLAYCIREVDARRVNVNDLKLKVNNLKLRQERCLKED